MHINYGVLERKILNDTEPLDEVVIVCGFSVMPKSNVMCSNSIVIQFKKIQKVFKLIC